MISTAQASRTLRQTADSSREMVEGHPASAALTAFGVGLGVGVAIGLMLTDSSSSRQNSYASYGKSASDYGNRMSDYSSRIADQIVRSLSEYLPDAISKRMG